MSCILSLACVVAVNLRFWARSKQKLPSRPDDWLMLPALVRLLLNNHEDRFKKDNRRLINDFTLMYSFCLLECQFAPFLVRWQTHDMTNRAHLIFSGIEKRVWGYPTPDPDVSQVTYDNSARYEGKVKFHALAGR